MKHSKKEIREAFSGAAGTYDLYAILQKEVASLLAEKAEACLKKALDRKATMLCADLKTTESALAITHGDAPKVLDIGCGTGNMTALLKEVFPIAAFHSTDLAVEMLKKTKERLGACVNVTASDYESLAYGAESFDIIVSSLAFQWAGDLAIAFKEAARVLKTDGLFFMATLGPETLNELKTCYNEASSQGEYPGPDAYTGGDALRSLISEAGLEVESIETIPVKKRYADMNALIRTLKKIGAAPAANKRTDTDNTGITLRRAGRIYNRRFPAPDGGIIATYEVIFATAKKPDNH